MLWLALVASAAGVPLQGGVPVGAARGSEETLHSEWLFAPAELPLDAADSAFDEAGVRLPHTVRELPWHDFDNTEYQFVSTYRRRFATPAGERVLLRFEGCMLACTVFVNGAAAGPEHRGGYTPFEYDVTGLVDPAAGASNVLQVSVDSNERRDIPPYGALVDYLTYGGIYRDVVLRTVPATYVASMFVRPQAVLSQRPSAEFDLELAGAGEVTVRCSILTRDGGEVLSSATALVGGSNATGPATVAVPAVSREIELWSTTNPALYVARVEIVDGTGAASTQTVEERIGFRTAEWVDDAFELNGERMHLFGLNRHQTYPYIGVAAPARLQAYDADLLKELGLNIARSSHYPASKAFLDRCDEIGLLVFEEIPGWQHIGNADWQEVSLAELEAMVVRDRNRASVVLWGVRINESPDNDDFYGRTNALCRALDPTRPTSGVRNFRGSNFLEDVFAYNDFSDGVEAPVEGKTPWLISEFNGHMFPTKSYDQEERAIEHLRRHAAIHNAAMGEEGVSGSIAWCMFDYATHRSFGSGDRTCYHGVLDSWRLPKFAGWWYMSQRDAGEDEECFLEAATYWTMGDRDSGGNSPITVLTNCDDVEVYFFGRRFGVFEPDRETYPHLAHPPVIVEGLSVEWGQAVSDLRLVGRRGGVAAAERRISADGVPKKLLAWTQSSVLEVGAGLDMTWLWFRVADDEGNRLPFSTKVVQVEVEGDAVQVVGEDGGSDIVLSGGQGGVFLRADNPGKATVRVRAKGLEEAVVEVEVVEV